MLEGLAVGKAVLQRRVDDGIGGVVRILHHEGGTLQALDVLLDEGRAELVDHPTRLLDQLLLRGHARLPCQAVARVAARMLHEERKGQLGRRPGDAVVVAGEPVGGRVDAPGATDPLHRLP